MQLRASGNVGRNDGHRSENSAAADAASAPPVTPVTREEWVQAVQADKYAISMAPDAMLDDALVDAAIHANTEALEYVPPQFQTHERLEALVRHDGGRATVGSITLRGGRRLGVARSTQRQTAQGVDKRLPV
jgi:hypothetical protein